MIIFGIIGCRKNGEYFWNNGTFLFNTVIFNLSSLNVLENYFKVANVFTIKATVLFPKSSYNYSGIKLIPQSNVSSVDGY